MILIRRIEHGDGIAVLNPNDSAIENEQTETSSVTTVRRERPEVVGTDDEQVIDTMHVSNKEEKDFQCALSRLWRRVPGFTTIT
ncbi:MAG TPA: hypothetical protein VF088_17340 [Pyrinomonadaceae bacterium]